MTASTAIEHFTDRYQLNQDTLNYREVGRQTSHCYAFLEELIPPPSAGDMGKSLTRPKFES
jgi:hypothetical protein